MARLSRLALAFLLLSLAPAALYAEDPGKITGKVVDADDKAVKDAAVTVLNPAAQDRNAASVATAKTGEDGTFTLEKVPAGKYTVRAMVRGKGVAVKQDVTVEAGKATDVGTLTLKVLKPIVGRPGGGNGLTPVDPPGADNGK